jgi:hypothetical protein
MPGVSHSFAHASSRVNVIFIGVRLRLSAAHKQQALAEHHGGTGQAAAIVGPEMIR